MLTRTPERGGRGSAAVPCGLSEGGREVGEARALTSDGGAPVSRVASASSCCTMPAGPRSSPGLKNCRICCRGSASMNVFSHLKKCILVSALKELCKLCCRPSRRVCPFVWTVIRQPPQQIGDNPALRKDGAFKHADPCMQLSDS